MSRHETGDTNKEAPSIRGHHLAGTVKRLVNGVSPEFLTGDRLQTFITQRGELTSDDFGRKAASGDSSLEWATTPEYAADRIGFTDEDTQVFIEQYKSALTTLAENPDDTPVEISAQPDGICKSCIFGHHCQLSQGEELIYLDTFRRVADEKKPGSYSVSQEYIDNDSMGLTMDRIVTDMGTVRDVLQGDDYENAYLAERRSKDNESKRSLRKFAHIFKDIPERE